MPRAALAFAVVFATGLILMLALGSLERRAEVFTLGVAPVDPLSVVPRTEVCQRSIYPPAAFHRVRLEVGSRGAAPPVFDVRVLTGGRVLARDSSRRTIGGQIAVVVSVGAMSADGPIAFCLRNTGRRPLQVYGNAGAANSTSSAFVNGKRIDYDLDLRFLRANDASLLSLTGSMVRRAALFRGEWIGPWAVWLVVVLLLAAFPLLLYRALRAIEY
jgi:hypothetical protein